MTAAAADAVARGISTELRIFVSAAAALRFLQRDATFSDIAPSAGITGSGISGQGACWGDYDNDGDLDLFLPAVGANSLFRNNGNATFTNVAAASGVAYAGAGSLGGSWCDYNRDGRLDLFVGTLEAPDRLYRGNADGTFTELADALGVADGAFDSFGGVWGDYDADGIDLFVHRDGVPNITTAASGSPTSRSLWSAERPLWGRRLETTTTATSISSSRTSARPAGSIATTAACSARSVRRPGSTRPACRRASAAATSTTTATWISTWPRMASRISTSKT